MQLILYKSNGKQYDITHTIDGIQWSGDFQQVARKLDIDILHPSADQNQKVILPAVGDRILMKEDGKEIFRGIIFFRDRSSKAQFTKITAYDALIYLTKSKGAYNFKNETPKGVTTRVCKDFSVPIGTLANPNTPRNFIAAGNTPYDIIMASYTYASTITGKKYIPRVEKGLLNVVEKGAEKVSVIIDESYNSFGTQYTENLEAMVNKVIIYDEKNNIVDTVENDSWINSYGTLQDAIQQQKDVDNRAIARKALKDIEKKANLEAFGNIRAITGNSIEVHDSVTGLSRTFFIDSDTHSWKNGTYTMQLNISFDNTMDEKEAESKEQSNQ